MRDREDRKEVQPLDLYIGLTDHSGLQVFLFFLLSVLGSWVTFHWLLLPALYWFFRQTLEAQIIHGPSLWQAYWQWEVILEQQGGETHYFFNPLLSLLPFVGLLGLASAFVGTVLLPPRWGLMRQKVRREVINMLDRVVRAIGWQDRENAYLDLEQQLLQMDVRSLHAFSVHHGIPIDDLEDLQRAIRWEHLPFWQKVWRINDAVKLYMRTYFTIEYGNQMLGLVYIGAAVLIILIGLRGLKFIPSTKPSVIIFALFLEFVVLILYAVTVIYTRSEEEGDWSVSQRVTSSSNSAMDSQRERIRQEARQLLETFLHKPEQSQ